jgi:DNA-binding NtrC family response regulator
MKLQLEDDYLVFIVDDDKSMRESLNHLLKKAGWQVEVFSKGGDLLDRVKHVCPDVILSDVRMPSMSGLELLHELSGVNSVPMVLISAHGDIPIAVQAMQKGAYSFIEKPFDPHRLLAALRNGAKQHRQSLETSRLRERLASLSGLDRIFLGETDIVKNLREEILDLSASNSSVLLLGETGTGKELVAHALHDLSLTAGKPFVALNCATLNSKNFEESMFGVFNGAKGIFAKADGGSLFLDEVAAMPLELQVKFLRVIEAQEFMRVGGDEPTKVNIRVICATNEDLDDAVKQGKFRKDLLFRINNMVLKLPPLSERKEDISLLFSHFLSQQAEVYEIEVPILCTEDIAALLAHDWQGNVRELRHVAERRVLAARRGRGSVAEAIAHDNETDEVPENLRGAVAAFEKQLIGQAIKNHQGKMDAVAEALGIGRRTLNEKIVKLGLKKEELL